MFKWNPQFETGVVIIDEQHQKLFEIGRRVHELLLNRHDSDHNETLTEVIKELHRYTVYHFEFEEGLMESANYPRLENHEKEHQEFVAKLERLANQDVNTFQVKVAFELLGFLSDWIEKHILNSDMDYQTYV